ncbi:phosphoglycerate dehydrogenase [Bacillus glycinifermentans]|uniref:Glycerate dehydrogenase n=1 Tax=Bacillus glycinifermentans TaxID=1664069 RepID=A0A0T6BJT4_9BACI|nr:phosphoglycerate dehydrogenase [Bacillus glycinifermentans]ATH93679.1 glycerate dehydrogenase [Bacillus glycinifermentans]KRT90145.1 glycerate dehydrogenase [Bacillus glycinifermentans]MEC0483831.1 phosphoglycerate dehydrogenase [Bacillus glycinifermentans]MEC0496325.1 phosphoglycerate dehydrogenase [Bacillus glycinifermentans]MEC0539382.1 phosphoglycerate dehydrogenase [Bacillus glycinifermentans]
MAKVLVTLSELFYRAAPRLKEKIEELGAECLFLDSKNVSREALLTRIKDVDIYVLGVEKADRELIDAAGKLRYIIKFGAGVDNIDVAYARQKGISVTNAPGQNASSVADLAFGLLLAGARSIPQTNAAVKNGFWKISMGYELDGKTLGLIGFGEIGKRIARRASGFNMNIMAYGTYKDYKSAKQLNVRFAELDDLLAKSDFVCISTSLRPETFHLMNEERLAKMKNTAFLINIARGEVIDENALIQALEQKKIRGAALDVFETEPPSARVTSLPNVICTSHIGGATFESIRRIEKITSENIGRFIGNEPLTFTVEAGKART